MRKPLVGCCSSSQADALSWTQVSASFGDCMPLGKEDHIPPGLGGCGKRRLELVAESCCALYGRPHTSWLACMCGPSPFTLHLHQHGPRDFRWPISVPVHPSFASAWAMWLPLANKWRIRDLCDPKPETSGATYSLPRSPPVSLPLWVATS